MVTTKEQERKELEKIRKIVAELGENSYVGTAFEGCFEDAESNIENDFGCSMKQRAESAEKTCESLRAENERLKMEMDDLKKALDKSEKKRLSMQDLETVSEIVSRKRIQLDSEIKNAAHRIVELADRPGDAQFRNAVNDHRVASGEMENLTKLSERITAAKLA